MLPVNETGLPRRTGLVPPFKAFMRNAQALNNPPSSARKARFSRPESQPGQAPCHCGRHGMKIVCKPRLKSERYLERVTGIEPVYSAWKAAALPLSYTRIFRSEDEWWRELDLNQRRLSQRIYSPSPLTTRASLHSFVRIWRPSFSVSTRVRRPLICGGYMTAQPAHVNTQIDEKFRKVSWIRHICDFQAGSMPAPCPTL